MDNAEKLPEISYGVRIKPGRGALILKPRIGKYWNWKTA